MSDARTGILLLNLGGPDSLDAVEPFLRNLFSDREIIKLSPLPFMQKFIAARIASARAPKVIPRYELIGGKSPILELTKAQASQLQSALISQPGADPVKVYVGMRYWHPYIIDTMAEMIADGVTKIVVLPLYPHYSRATTGSCFSEVKKALSSLKKKGAASQVTEVRYIDSWYDNPGYLDALAHTITEGLAKFSPEARHNVDILFSAHALPQDFIDDGDPYKDHLEETVAGVLERLNANSDEPGGRIKWHMAYQSRSGPVKWMEPGTDDAIRRLGAEGCKALLVIPISFVSDHIETLYEIDMMYRDIAVESGIASYGRAPSLNESPLFIKALGSIVAPHLS